MKKVTCYSYLLHFSKVTCYSYCYISKVTSYFTSYFIDMGPTLLHHLNCRVCKFYFNDLDPSETRISRSSEFFVVNNFSRLIASNFRKQCIEWCAEWLFSVTAWTSVVTIAAVTDYTPNYMYLSSLHHVNPCPAIVVMLLHVTNAELSALIVKSSE